MYPEWRKRRFFELHLAWLVQGPKGYDLLFKINPYSLYATREEALEAARALVEKGRLDQDERVGRNKAPVLLSEEDKARFLLLLERGKALLPLDRYALLGEVAEVEERGGHASPRALRLDACWRFEAESAAFRSRIAAGFTALRACFAS